MSSLLLLKAEVHKACHRQIDDRIANLQHALRELQEASGNETKSSAGDKYETARAMLHLEKEKLAAQLDASLKMKKVVNQLGVAPKNGGLGCLIRTDKGIFYLSVSLGRMEFDEPVICLSPVAPLGNVLKTARKGQQVSFGGTNYEILDLV